MAVASTAGGVLAGAHRDDARDRRADSPSSVPPGGKVLSVRPGGERFARVVRPILWRPGDEVTYGATFTLPRGFRDRLEGQADLLRADNWPDDPGSPDRLAVVVYAGDHRAHLVRQRLGREQVALGRPFTLPEGRRFRLDVHARLASSTAERTTATVTVDGREVTRTRAATSYGRRLVRVRFGLVAVDEGRQRRGLSLRLAAPTARRVG